MTCLLESLHQKKLLVGDGAMGTMLQQAGLAPGACPELFNLDRPDAVESIMRAYKQAGADLLETNTFGGSPAKLAVYGLEDRCAEINEVAARIGRRAAGDDTLLVGSIGPTGQLLAPLGTLTEQQARRGFELQADALASGGVDMLCVETMTDLNEAVFAVEAAARTGLDVLATMTFEATRRGFFTIMGVTVEQAVTELQKAGAAAVGSNCGTGPDTMLEVARVFTQLTDLPLVIQANAGLPQLVDGEVVYPATPEYMASFVEDFYESRVKIIGGCCGTTPDHIRAIVKMVGKIRSK